MTISDRIARCDREMAEAERYITAGAEPLESLVLWLSDWAAEKRRLQAAAKSEPAKQETK